MVRQINSLINVDHEDAILRVFILFVQTAQAVLKYTDAYLYRKMRFSTTKLVVMRILASNSKAMMPSEIAKWTQTERHNITTLIKRISKEGLIKIERNTNDKRALNVVLTDKGREFLSQVMPVAKEIIDKVMLSISEDDALLLEKLLGVLRRNAHRSLESLAE